MVDYSAFTAFSRTIVKDGSLSDFKSSPFFTAVLEHVTAQLGHEYYQRLRSISPLTREQITAYCKKNDIFGGGMKHDFEWITTSPSNFRYLLHSHLILSQMKQQGQEEVRVVEVGCGYGGLCLALTDLAASYGIKIKEYHLIDLPDVSSLQKLYLSKFTISADLFFHPASRYGEDIQGTGMFLISNYCFSEIDEQHQKQYIRLLFPKVVHGFMTWNNIPLYDFGFAVTVEAENPLTSNNPNPSLNNKYVWF